MKKKSKKMSRFRKRSEFADEQEFELNKKLRIKKIPKPKKKMDWRDLIMEEKDLRLYDE